MIEENSKQEEKQLIKREDSDIVKQGKLGLDKNNEKKEKKSSEKDKRNYLLRESARMEKWSSMIRNIDHFYFNNYKKLKTRTRKGIPDCLRGYVWYNFGNVQKYLNADENKGLYEKLLYDETFNAEIENTIICDIDRTFPKHTFFKDKYGLGSLYNVLRSYSKYNQKIGYVQGMGFITALFLTYMDEESAFWLLHSLMDKYGMDGYYLPDIPDLPKSFYKFLLLMKKHLPKVFDHMTNKNRGVVPSMYASQWFITLFAVNVRSDIHVRIIDIFLLEGQKVIHKLGLAILKINEERILSGKSLDDIMPIFKAFDNLNVEDLFSKAFSFNFGKNTLKEFEKSYLDSLTLKNNDEILDLCK